MEAYLKKTIAFVVLFIACAVVPVCAETITLNGKMVDNRLLVPLRPIFENLGANVEWDAGTKAITGTKGTTVVNLTINQNEAYVNGNVVILDVPAKVIDGSTYVPLRFIAGSLGADVTYNSATSTANIMLGTTLITVKNSSTAAKTSTVTSGKYVGSDESDKYHYASCRWAKKILPQNEIWFKDEAAARAAGYVPCGVCKP